MAEPGFRPLAVVTGASSGIGYELARVFAENGFDLVIAADTNEIDHAAVKLSRPGVFIDAVQVDLSRRKGVTELYERIVALERPVEALAINAGIGLGGDFLETDLNREIKIINLNVASSVALAKLIMRDMEKMGGGRVLFTTSIAAEAPGPHYAVYAATKAFLQSFSQAVREEVKDRGIVVTALQPGATDTEFFQRARMLDTKIMDEKLDDPAEVAEEGFAALMAGKDYVITGSFKNKVRVALEKFLPEKWGAKLQGMTTEPRAT